MNQAKEKIQGLTLPENIEDLLEQLESEEKIEDFATRLVNEYYKKGSFDVNSR
ncbi:hypothetical protein [Ammoniphilus sp. CFH 90114]|uniref:hypothetical protein n=1 Tax=Ammoniphilus sp. CFH 90114 TaxID=2493665 RepID=UPI0013E97FBD|nr:hypothetical protein [Ammoniphilus sp. CFH 90114]